MFSKLPWNKGYPRRSTCPNYPWNKGYPPWFSSVKLEALATSDWWSRCGLKGELFNEMFLLILMSKKEAQMSRLSHHKTWHAIVLRCQVSDAQQGSFRWKRWLASVSRQMPILCTYVSNYIFIPSGLETSSNEHDTFSHFYKSGSNGVNGSNGRHNDFCKDCHRSLHLI